MKHAHKILLVEDDPVLGMGLVTFLELEGYQVEWKKTVESGLDAFEEGGFSLVSLDIGLPDGSGTDLCKEIREKDKTIPIIFLTAKTDEDTLVRGLEIGANDFVKKPFSHKELHARMKVLLRATTWQAESEIGGAQVFPDRREIHYNGKPLDLNRRQFEILSYFLSRPDQIISREQLLVHLGQDGAIFDRTVDSHLSQLRKVLKANEVTTFEIAPIYGVGYRLEIK
ncbi:MAG: response regulator transcription factor [Bdellovibrionota bacterium]